MVSHGFLVSHGFSMEFHGISMDFHGFSWKIQLFTQNPTLAREEDVPSSANYFNENLLAERMCHLHIRLGGARIF